MGYFSRMAVELAERAARWEDRSYPCCMDPLELYLDQLNDRLEELDMLRPCDPMAPLYDSYFYEGHLPGLYEIPDTVEGVLAAIHQVEGLIEAREQRIEDHHRLLSSIRDTGATPEGQYVFLWAFLPYYQQTTRRGIV